LSINKRRAEKNGSGGKQIPYVATGYRATHSKCNEDIRGVELRDINALIKTSQE
jgi:hypothetical protein